MKKILTVISLVVMIFGVSTSISFALPAPADMIQDSLHNNQDTINNIRDNSLHLQLGPTLGDPVMDFKTPAFGKIARVIRNLEKVKTKLEASNFLTSQEKSEVLSVLDSALERLKNKKQSIESDGDFTEGEFNQSVEIIKKDWLKARNDVYRNIIKKRIERKEKALNKLQTFVDKVEIYIEASDSNSSEIKNAKRKLSEIKVEIVSIKASLRDANNELGQIASDTSWNSSKTHFAQINNDLKSATRRIKKSKKLGREILIELRKLVRK